MTQNNETKVLTPEQIENNKQQIIFTEIALKEKARINCSTIL